MSFNIRQAWAWLVLSLLAGGVALVYVAAETPVYYWDYSNYHSQLQSLISVYQNDGLAAVALFVRDSLRESDYNVSPLLLLLPLALFATPSRQVYIASLLVIGLPTVCFLSSYLSRFCWLPLSKRKLFVFFVVIPLFSPLLWASALRGYPDLLALIPLAFLSLCSAKSRHFLRLNSFESFGAGILFWLTFAFRRHMAYALVALYVGSFLCALYFAARKQRIFRLIRVYFFIACGVLLPLALFQSVLVARILATSYSDVYAAYDLGATGNLAALFSLTGPIWPIFWGIGLIYAIFKRRSFVLFYAFLAFSSYLLFQFTQKPGPHHVLPIVLWMLPAASWPCCLSLRHTYSSLQRYSATFLVLFAYGLTWLLTFVPGLCSPSGQGPPVGALAGLPRIFRVFAGAVSHVCPQRSFPPLRLRYYDFLTKFLQSDLPFIPCGSRVGVVASSPEFNSEILQHIATSRQNRGNASTLIIRSLGDIDRRDGYDIHFLRQADYLISTDPPLIHRPDQYQKVVTLPSRAFSKPDARLSRYWAKVPLDRRVSSLPDGTSILLFKRVGLRSADSLPVETRFWLDVFRSEGSLVRYTRGRIVFD